MSNSLTCSGYPRSAVPRILPKGDNRGCCQRARVRVTMAERNGAHRENPTLHVASRIPNPLRIQTSWTRAPSLCRLPGIKQNHDPKPISAPLNAGTTGQSERSSMVHKDGPEERCNGRAGWAPGSRTRTRTARSGRPMTGQDKVGAQQVADDRTGQGQRAAGSR